MAGEIRALADAAGVGWFDYQLDALRAAQAMPGPSQRVCLYYRTGAGKSYTALGLMRLWGHEGAVVIAPPSTHPQWEQAAERFGVKIQCFSHAKFRMKDFAISRSTPVIADEMHLFGGHGGKGWAKLERMARGLKAPLVMASATPNYNDADRVYCIQRILDPHSCKGGFKEFLYRECITQANPFAIMPDVLGFKNFPDAAAYLAALPGVFYLPDDLVYTIEDEELLTWMPSEYERYGYNRREHRLVASQIEDRHTRIFQRLVDVDGYLHQQVEDFIMHHSVKSKTPVLIFAAHSTVAEAIARTLGKHPAKIRFDLVTGKTPKSVKSELIQDFRDGKSDMLIGTATLATGTDGLDKVCDTLLIVDDTDDDALRRQLIGRIMPRGADADASKKQVQRLLP